MTDHELLLAEAEMFWGFSATGRMRPGGPALVLAVSGDDTTLLFGADVAGDAAARIRRLVEESGAQALGRCASLLDRTGLISGGPSYLIPPAVAFASDAEVVGSDDPGRDRLRGANPGNWERQEWRDLLDGALGPWAMTVHEGRVTSICHTPAWSEVAADAGVWTDPEFRGRGLAAVTTVAWFRLITATGRIAFYSTSSWNRSSQRVAARLGLRPIGWLWKLTPLRTG
ncbi:MAG TPA: GNAT family N-acetyltransferase [Mycobacteriales bacterium]|nr:GNAT family N-acetyltransferase [Mycobacteriales bacterium]